MTSFVLSLKYNHFDLSVGSRFQFPDKVSIGQGLHEVIPSPRNTLPAPKKRVVCMAFAVRAIVYKIGGRKIRLNSFA